MVTICTSVRLWKRKKDRTRCLGASGTYRRLRAKYASPDVQLKGLEFTANCTAFGTTGTVTVLFAREDVDAVLAQAADALGARVACAQEGQSSTRSAVNVYRLSICRRRV